MADPNITTYVPALEHTELGKKPNVIMTVLTVIALIVLMLLALPFAALVVHAIIVDSIGHSAYLVRIIAPMAGLCLFALVVLSALGKTFFWETLYMSIDSEGIVIQTTVSKKRVPWTEIIEAEKIATKGRWKNRVEKFFMQNIAKYESYPGYKDKMMIWAKIFGVIPTQITLKRNGKPIRIAMTEKISPTFEASLWQHLHKRGIKNNLKLSKDAKSLLHSSPDDTESPDYLISDSIPQEIIWDYWESKKSVQPDVRIEIDRDGITSEAFGERATILWADVTKAYWWKCDILFVEGKSNLKKYDEIQVPVVLSDADSVRVSLAVIRQVRSGEKPQMIIIPEKLHKAAKDHGIAEWIAD